MDEMTTSDKLHNLSSELKTVPVLVGGRSTHNQLKSSSIEWPINSPYEKPNGHPDDGCYRKVVDRSHSRISVSPTSQSPVFHPYSRHSDWPQSLESKS